MAYLRRISLLMAVIGSLGGCSGIQPASPTHSWSSYDASANEYRFDNYQCMSKAGVSSKEMKVNGADFEAYTNCMLDRGYALRTY